MRISIHLSLALLAGVTCGLANAQPVIGPQIRVDPNNSTNAAVNETSMGVADADGSDIFGGWNDYRNNIKSFFTLSLDGGNTWTDFAIRPPAQFQTSVEGDPMTAFDHRDGTLYAGAMAFGGNGGIYVARKDPGSSTFNPAVMARVSGSVDKGWMCVGPDPADLSNPNKSILYIAYNQGLSRSTDKGATWAGPVSIASGSIGFLPRVGPSGTLYILYWDFGNGIWMRKSTNGGQSLTTAVRVATRLDVWGIDGSRFPGGFRVPPLAYLAVDPNDETLYVVYFDTTAVSGGNRDVDLYFTKSTDGGSTWATPSRINGSQGNIQADSFFPWLEVDRSGRIGVLFYDTRNVAQNDSAAHAQVDTYYSYSEDAGATWTEHRLTPTAWNSQFDGIGGGFIGDYLGMGQAQGAAGSYSWPLYLATHGNQPHQYTHKIYHPCPGDFNADEAINTQDVLSFLNAWNSQDPRADRNGDGVWNTLDVLSFLNSWNGPCP
ncbi:MAG TPA: GC-type dockerin domain-anchored protein [Phycisphaerales bacterium]|nr:GC-type dockerin domain-anchored protein [Phycisphaerales bacterium]